MNHNLSGIIRILCEEYVLVVVELIALIRGAVFSGPIACIEAHDGAVCKICIGQGGKCRIRNDKAVQRFLGILIVLAVIILDDDFPLELLCVLIEGVARFAHIQTVAVGNGLGICRSAVRRIGGFVA